VAVVCEILAAIILEIFKALLARSRIYRSKHNKQVSGDENSGPVSKQSVIAAWRKRERWGVFLGLLIVCGCQAYIYLRLFNPFTEKQNKKSKTRKKKNNDGKHNNIALLHVALVLSLQEL